MKYAELIKTLNPNQKNAVKIEKNAVVSAGAGSGKTKVLSSRFVHLVVNKKIAVDKILTLTFTKKAAAEMYGRIYKDLQALDAPEAKKAVLDFQKAQIMTLDAFSNTIARIACKGFGISPDFSTDPSVSDALADFFALEFFLRNRKNKQLQIIMGDDSLKKFVTNLFAKTLKEFVTITKKVDVVASLKRQSEEIENLFTIAVENVARAFDALLALPDGLSEPTDAAKKIIQEIGEFPETSDVLSFEKFVCLVDSFFSLDLRKGARSDEVKNAKDIIREVRNQVEKFKALFSFIFYKDALQEVFALIDTMQDEFIVKKRVSGVLTFNDVAQLAVDALKKDPDLRLFYKNSFDAIMIDEFQDNNSLQKDLLYLLAEKKEHTARSVISTDELELEESKLFFVGDDKQSIYAFRGADVSVFRELATNFPSKNTSLSVNYRSEKRLLHIFNALFSNIFVSPQTMQGSAHPYEALFSTTESHRDNPEVEASIDILVVNETALKTILEIDPLASKTFLTKQETEAYAVVRRICELYNNKAKVCDKGIIRECRWADFAILMRASTHQGPYEKYLREAGVPYKAVQQKGLFYDAPINDLYALMRLSLYQNDRASYAQVLRSPFIVMSDKGLATILLSLTPPFEDSVDALLDDSDRLQYAKGRDLFSRVCGYYKTLSNAEILTKLWFDEGYRYILVTNKKYHNLLDLYDSFFELARRADEAGITAVEFIEEIASAMEDGRIDELDISFDEDEDVVKIMSVHKSKGLEFPIVCIPNCDNTGLPIKKDGRVFFSQEFGLSIHTPPVKKMGGDKSNLFFEYFREEAAKKQIAELKRLLYVAMTRAECHLIISGSLPFDSTETRDEIHPLVNCEVADISSSKCSFFQLLMPALKNKEFLEDKEIQACIRFKEIDPLEKKEAIFSFNQNKQKQKKPYTEGEIISLYDSAAVKKLPTTFQKRWTVTEFAEAQDVAFFQKKSAVAAGEVVAKTKRGEKEEDLSATELGTLAHALIEAHFLGAQIDLPQKQERLIQGFCDTFFSSELGKMAQEAEWRKSEYSFITRYKKENRKEDGQEKIVSGQMDLVFKHKAVVYIVDYKTDTVENPEQHAFQLSLYKKAFSEILIHFYKEPMEIKTFLFYLRSGRAVEL